MGRFGLFLLKTSALLSACGGPLVVMDALKPVVGDPWHVVVGFLPVGLAALGTFSLAEDERDAPARVFAWAGLVGAVALVPMNAWAALRLAGRADRGLIVFGMIVGTACTVAYVAAFRRWRSRADRQRRG